ncbi:TadE/TadG family type IV pilus assembly protein [Methylobacterium sp. J-076]|uniref:TadE/TadG family type IV pilus assembly protein n=1 Tax=Methylobacterium sp. J-076 TaxID=2836655 RepID=UPI001FBACB4A|nr:TadE/TadG family type IV pilus assembly protein [Methylobacterium sp. J-076]MCJ2012221.1 pilus assembly protein [Methylobacterium sp. J-076]
MSRQHPATVAPLPRPVKLGSCRRGGAAVEFALIAPMLISLFAAITVLGIFIGAAQNLRLVTAEAARASIAGITDAERASIARDTVMRSLANGAMFKPGSVAVQVGTDAGDPNVTVVTVTLDATTLGLGLFSRILPQLPNALTSTVSVRRGGL